MTFNVTFYTYSGMPIYLGEGVSKEEAAALIRHKIKRARTKGNPVTKIDKGRWEFETPENAFAISDNEGLLTVRRNRVRR